MPRLDIDCPLCGSRQTERAALAWSKGLSRTESTTLGIGGLLALPLQAMTGGASPLSLVLWPLLLLKSFFGFGLFAARNWGRSQSIYSMEAAPPFRFPTLKAILLYPFIVAALLFIQGLAALLVVEIHGSALMPQKTYMPIAMAVALALPVAVIVLGVFYNRRVWPRREALWQRSFLCKRCGASFVVPDYDPVGENAVRSDRAGRGGLLPLAGAPETRAQARAKAESDERLLRKKRTGVTH